MSENAQGIIAPAAGEIQRECQVCDATAPKPLSLCAACRVGLPLLSRPPSRG